VTTTPGALTPETQQTLFDHASRLHQLAPDQALPRDGEPFPDDHAHRQGLRPKPPRHRVQEGMEAASLLAGQFADPAAKPCDLASAFHGLYVPIHPNGHIDSAAEDADRELVLSTGRWLVRNGTDRCAVTIGLAILGAVGIEAPDVPLVQTIGLLSDRFGPLAARALKGADDAAGALLWLAERVQGWGRVYVVETLCGLRETSTYPWLLHRAVNGDFLNGYFAGKVAHTVRLHEAADRFSGEPELVDATGRLLHVMSECGGMGATLGTYPYSGVVLDAHSRALARLDPTPARIRAAAVIAGYLRRGNPADAAASAAWNAACARYIETLSSEPWADAARAAVAREDRATLWIAGNIAQGLGLSWATIPAERPRDAEEAGG
jgi:hypothetical protein